MKLTPEEAPVARSLADVDCGADPVASLVQMFVELTQRKRIDAGQSPALRPVFLKPHGVARGRFVIRQDIPETLRIGVFAGSEHPAWVRFSSDTLPTLGDFGSTTGIGIKLFGVPGDKLLGDPDARTMDFILQNHPVFFVDTARDMCEFTRAGVILKDYDAYLRTHPETARILNDMQKPVGSALAIDYWSILPFALGPSQFVKYKLEPTFHVEAPGAPPADPTYLATDLAARLKAGEVRFRFCIQLRTNEETMPLDRAMVPWSEVASRPIHVADLILPQQDVTARGQAEYGENLSINIWRVPEAHRPVGSIAEVRRAVYAASAELRRNVNGVPTGEPDEPRPAMVTPPAVDSVIVRAKIHPGIGIARVGDSGEFYLAPEVTDPAPQPPGFYRDGAGALKREAAQFRIYGYNAAGQVVRELTADNADIAWTVHVANRKAEWYRFLAALDIPDAVDMKCERRNQTVKEPAVRAKELVIDPGAKEIHGRSLAVALEGGAFTGKDKEGKPARIEVSLGEIRTDEKGRLRVIGGAGKSASPGDSPLYIDDDDGSFNNADNWYDDTSDGPVTAAVSINGSPIPVEHAWVVVGPPNYAPNVIGWRTMYDLLLDTYTQAGWLPMPAQVSFTQHILPFLQRLSNLQWVNKGFAAMFGKGAPLDFESPTLLARLSHAPALKDRGTPADTWSELRRTVMNSFRPHGTTSAEPRSWPWLYGDAFGSFAADSPRNNLDLPLVTEALFRRWAAGDFVNDWHPEAQPPRTLDAVPIAEQPAMLDKAAMHFCLADAFHPGCEMTWPMRHASMYEAPFRIRRREGAEPDYGKELTQPIALRAGGPLYGQSPGTISRWMALPWQGDTAFCRSGYEAPYDPYVPSFWPARVPNQVLTEEEYRIVMDESLPRERRLAAFNNRAFWTRGLRGGVAEVMQEMIAHFQRMGVVEARPGIRFDPDFPAVIFVESIPAERKKDIERQLQERKGRLLAAAAEGPPPLHELAGWESEEQWQQFRRVRVRFQR